MEKMTIKSFMNTDFARINEDMLVVTAAIELIKKEAIGGPVTDSDNKLTGWISGQECLHVTTQFAYHNQRIGLVKDNMRVDVLSVNADDTVFSLAEKMLGAQPKSYPVIDENNKVVGVITRRRILKALLDHYF